MENTNILEIQGLNKAYEDFALKDVSFALPRGYIMGFVGQNGSGKTTTIRSILNMAKLDSGKISVFGLDSVTDSIAVNSCHHQGIRALAPRLAVSAVAEDGLIEAAFMPEKRFVRLVQWHPELMPPDDSLSRRLFRDFVVCCR